FLRVWSLKILLFTSSCRQSHQSRAPCLFKLEERRDLRKTYERSSLASTCQLTLQKPMKDLLMEAPWLHSSRYSRCFQRAGTNHCALTDKHGGVFRFSGDFKGNASCTGRLSLIPF